MVTESLFPDAEYSSHFLTGSAQSGKLLDLATLYELTDWRCVHLGGVNDRTYHNMPVISMFKALVLPYLAPIPGERTLARIIVDNPTVQDLCGFQPKNLPQKRTFWHFRNKYKTIYSEIMLKVLISLVLSGYQPNYNLPFVTKTDDRDQLLRENGVEIILDNYRPPIYVNRPNGITESSRINDVDTNVTKKLAEERIKLFQGKKLGQYRVNVKKYEQKLSRISRKKAQGFVLQMDLPVDVMTTLVNSTKIYFRIAYPHWFDNASKQPIRIWQYSREFGIAKKSSKYDKACNILIIRESQGKDQILLSRRKEKGFGAGAYAVPGGKQKPLETLEECAKRELLEETNIALIESRPVSIFYTLKDPNDPTKQIMSVGVLAVAWEGELTTMEPDTHEAWNWFDIDSLPEPIFEPTLIALDQYRAKKYPDLEWKDFEEKPTSQLNLFDPI